MKDKQSPKTPNVDTESEDGSWREYIESMRNLINIEERDPKRNDEEE